jgi:hypothetical protein
VRSGRPVAEPLVDPLALLPSAPRPVVDGVGDGSPGVGDPASAGTPAGDCVAGPGASTMGGWVGVVDPAANALRKKGDRVTMRTATST